jgi:hypothetical protein
LIHQSRKPENTKHLKGALLDVYVIGPNKKHGYLLLLHTGACSKDFKLSSGKFEQEGIGGDSDITTMKRALPRVER